MSVEEFRDTTSVCCGVQRYCKCLLRSSEILQVSVEEFSCVQQITSRRLQFNDVQQLTRTSGVSK